MLTLDLKKYTRWQAFISHLAISFIIFLILLAIIVFAWFPGPLIHVGGWQGIKIVAGIDLVLGPLLTLIVFNPNKKSLRMDLSIIALFQVSALCYGSWIIHNERPYIISLSHEGVTTITKKEAIAGKINLEQLIGKAPYRVVIDLPKDPELIKTAAFTTSFFQEHSMDYRQDLYLNFPATNVQPTNAR